MHCTRLIFSALLVILLGACEENLQPHQALPEWQGFNQWQRFKDCFIQSDGRVIDWPNEAISHSEGQGYAMVLATAINDRKTFNKLWRWTQDNLKIRNDGLFAWRWQPNKPHIIDSNNASDGDLLIAWALLRGAIRWQDHSLKKEGTKILNEISEILVKRNAETILLPAAYGFIHNGQTTLNQSYYIYPALYEAALHQPQGPWKDLLISGFDLQENTQNLMSLPSDWIVYKNNKAFSPQSLSFPEDKHKIFGYEAVRVPLYACWINRCDTFGELIRLWKEDDSPSAWVKSDSKAKYALHSGGMAIRSLLLNETIAKKHQLNTCQTGSDYYSAVLSLLAQVAQIEKDAYFR